MYKIVWKFRAKRGFEKEFEKAYASDGPWVRLFGKACGYVGTEFLRDCNEERTYLTVDIWKSKQDFERFKIQWKSEYEALDIQFGHLTEIEESIGQFTCLNSESKFLAGNNTTYVVS